MNRRQALRSGLLTAIAGIVPLPVLQKAIQLHDVKIYVDEDKKATMRIDDGELMSLSSFVLRIDVYRPPVNVMFRDNGTPRMDLIHLNEEGK